MEISNDTIGNRTRDLPTCSARPSFLVRVMIIRRWMLALGNRTHDLPTCSAGTSFLVRVMLIRRWILGILRRLVLL